MKKAFHFGHYRYSLTKISYVVNRMHCWHNEFWCVY